ncbi:hypothetical protein MTO96_003462 [Rhipicephalus appendiculatus]
MSAAIVTCGGDVGLSPHSWKSQVWLIVEGRTPENDEPDASQATAHCDVQLHLLKVIRLPPLLSPSGIKKGAPVIRSP